MQRLRSIHTVAVAVGIVAFIGCQFSPFASESQLTVGQVAALNDSGIPVLEIFETPAEDYEGVFQGNSALVTRAERLDLWITSLAADYQSEKEPILNAAIYQQKLLRESQYGISVGLGQILDAVVAMQPHSHNGKWDIESGSFITDKVFDDLFDYMVESEGAFLLWAHHLNVTQPDPFIQEGSSSSFNSAFDAKRLVSPVASFCGGLFPNVEEWRDSLNRELAEGLEPYSTNVSLESNLEVAVTAIGFSEMIHDSYDVSGVLTGLTVLELIQLELVQFRFGQYECGELIAQSFGK